MKPRTEEQQAFVDQVTTGDPTKGSAYAGTGKTHTLVITAEEALRGKRVANMCFNRSTKEEANTRFPSHVKNYTWHGYAVPMAKQMRFFEGRKTGPMGVVVGLEQRPELSPLIEVTRDERKAAFVAMQTLTRFCQSNDRRPEITHVPAAFLSRAKPGEQRTEAGKIAIKVARDLWEAICARGSQIPMTFDHYLKAWALTDPVLPFDTVLLDEAQDSNPVTLSVMMAQPAQQVYVGDSWQQIYAWRGAVDAMRFAPGEEVKLTHSFRFGPEIATQANEVLRLLGEEKPLIGRGPEGVVLDDLNGVSDRNGAVLCRGNSGVIKETLKGFDAGKRVAVVGGTDEAVRLLTAAYDLFRQRRPNHPELGIFDDWLQLAEFAESDEGASYRPIVRTVEDYGDGIPRLCDRLKYGVERSEASAELVVSTAHKAKGREWDDVRFSDDFPVLAERDPSTGDPILHEEECNLVYVSITRGMKRLNLAGYGETIRQATYLMGRLPPPPQAPLKVADTRAHPEGASPIVEDDCDFW